MYKDVYSGSDKTFIAPIKWCRYIVNVSYMTVALIIMAHLIWYFAARSVLVWPPDIYLRYYIILPAIGLFALVIFTDLLVRFSRFSLLLKESLSLSLIIVISFYLCLTHNIAEVLLGSFILPIFVSTIFSNVKITRWVFWTSNFAVLLLGVIRYFTGKLNSDMVMQIFVASFMFLCSYLLAKILIRYGHDNLAALTNFDNKQQYMQEQLKLDPFTGLFNRKTFDDYLPKLMEECRSTNKNLSLALIDVDHFKYINDLYGHAAGDRVLLYFSQILKIIQTENILTFRMGGDEFSVVFRDCNVEEAYSICEEIRNRMESCPMRAADEKRVTLCCGVVCMNPKDVDLEKFTKAADSALYAAKNNGRNQIIIHHHT